MDMSGCVPTVDSVQDTHLGRWGVRERTHEAVRLGVLHAGEALDHAR